MLDVVTFKWSKPGYRSTFTALHVNVLHRMVRRHYRGEFRFNCVTDDARGVDPEIRVIPLWPDHASVPNPQGAKFPSCYRRLKLFSPEARQMFGERIVSLDLDMVLTADVTPVWDRTEDFVIARGLWGGAGLNKQVYNGSMLLLRTGSRPQVWEKFDPHTSPRAAISAGYRGSDQGWIGFVLGPTEAIWGPNDGVYSYRNDLRPNGPGRLPDNARVVSFHGKFDPWAQVTQSMSPWIKKHWC